MLVQPQLGQNTGLEVKVTSDLSTEPVTVTEFKTYARFTLSDEDTLIGELITSARLRLEAFTGRSFGEKTINAYWQTFSKEVELPYPPVTAITSVSTIYKGESTALVSGEDYYTTGLDLKILNLVNVPSWKWGVTKTSLSVIFTAGYTTLPKALKEAILKEANTAWLNRENFMTDVIKGGTEPLSNEAKMLAQPYRIYV